MVTRKEFHQNPSNSFGTTIKNTWWSLLLCQMHKIIKLLYCQNYCSSNKILHSDKDLYVFFGVVEKYALQIQDSGHHRPNVFPHKNMYFFFWGGGGCVDNTMLLTCTRLNLNLTVARIKCDSTVLELWLIQH